MEVYMKKINKYSKCPHCERRGGMDIWDNDKWRCGYCGAKFYEDGTTYIEPDYYTYICQKCGSIYLYAESDPNKICKECESPHIVYTGLTKKEYLMTKANSFKNDDIKKQLREKYTFHSPYFDEVLYNTVYKKEHEGVRSYIGPSASTPSPSTPQIHCPTCGSTNIVHISAASKAVGAYTFGLFSKTAKSQFRCKDCGYKW